MSKRTAPNRLNALMAAMMAKAMLDAPCTFDDLQELTGLARATVARYVRAMKEQKCVRIAQWEQDRMGRFVLPSFQIGTAKDTPRPKTDRIARSRRERYHLRKQMRLNAALAAPMGATA